MRPWARSSGWISSRRAGGSGEAEDARESAARDPRRIQTVADQQITSDQIRREHLEVGRYELFR